MGKLVGGSYYKALKGIFLCARKKVVLLRLLVLIQFPFRQDNHVHVAGEQLPQGGLDFPYVTGGNNIPL